MKYNRQMPKDDQPQYKLISEGEKRFQITDIHSEDEKQITLKCEVISEVDKGESVFYRISNDPSNKFFWLTKLFLKCIGEPHNGDVVIDTDAFIGRQFNGEVVHPVGKDGKTYANIKKLIYDEHYKPEFKSDTDEIKWDA